MASVPPSSQRLTFPGAEGDSLDARLELPGDEPSAYALLAHCFTCGKDIKAASTVARGLAEAGIAVMRIDFTGLGSSDGDFANTNFSTNVDDLVAAARYLRERGQGPGLMVGHSLGGAAVLAAAGRLDEPCAVATIAAPFDPAHVRRLLGSDAARIEREGETTVTLAERSFTIKRQFLDDIADQRMAEVIAALRTPLIVFHAPTDDLVAIDDARQIFEAARHPKSFVSLAGADHLLSRRADALYVARVLGAWASRYLAPG
jgi:alpha-beta hydrolase superfamily lysophospholipase